MYVFEKVGQGRMAFESRTERSEGSNFVGCAINLQVIIKKMDYSVWLEVSCIKIHQYNHHRMH
jgi:hypothetical protein